METQYQESEELTLRSERVRDVMDKMPSWFERWGITVILIFIAMALFFSWIIKYPEIILSEVTITTINPPLKIVTKVAGNLRLMQIASGSSVEKGQYLAVVENPAVAGDILTLKEKLAVFKEEYIKNKGGGITFFPENLSLGLLQNLYHEFLTTYQEILLMQDLDRNGSQISFLQSQVQNHQALLRSHEVLKLVKQEELQLFRKKTDRELHLFQAKVIAEKDYEDARIIWLNKNDAYENFNAELVKIKSQIQDLNNQVHEIIFNETETTKRLELALWKHYYSLVSGIVDWEQTYVLKAPINGNLEYLNFWKDNQFVDSGEEVFSVVPENSPLLGHAEMPTHGAGKVEVGQRVQIILANFPHKEFGTVSGIVEEISPLTKETETFLGKENFYLISVSLPNALRTNFNKELSFKHNMVGQAQIITKERRFIERIFENIFYIFNQ